MIAAGCGGSDAGSGSNAGREGASGALGVGESPTDGAAVPVVYAVNYPLAYFAERIAGDLITVEFPAPADIDPALWSPGAETVAAYQQADLILLNGAGYAAWVDRVSLPGSRLVNTTGHLADRYVAVEDAPTHSHGPEGEHSHGAIAFTTWLDPALAVEQARTVRDALVRIRPAREGAFGEGFAALERDLVGLDGRLAETVGADPQRPLLASHPIYQYLAARYDLNLRSVHFEPDEPPGRAEWRRLVGLLDEQPANWMLWEAEPLPETASRLRELGVESLVFSPAANRPEGGDYLDVMAENTRALARAFEAPGG